MKTEKFVELKEEELLSVSGGKLMPPLHLADKGSLALGYTNGRGLTGK